MRTHKWARRPGTRDTAPGGARQTVVALLLLAVSTVPGCLRLDTPPPEHPELTSEQAARQDAAHDASVIAEAADRIAPGQPDHVAAVLTEIADEARAQEQALGGIWIAWPEGAPEGVATPAPSPSADPTVLDPAGILTRLDASWVAARAAASTPEATDDEALTHAALAVSRAAQATALADALGVPAPNHADPASLPVPVALPGTDAADLVLAYDSARYGLETAAARLPEPYSGWTFARAAQLRTALETALAAGAEDRRTLAYPSGNAAAQPDALLMARAAEKSVLALLQSTLPDAAPEERTTVLDGATTSAALVVRLGGDVPALPGVVVDPATSPTATPSPTGTTTPSATTSPTG